MSKKIFTGVFVEKKLPLVGLVIDVIIKNDKEFVSNDEFIAHLNKINRGSFRIISEPQVFEFEMVVENK